MKKKLLFASLIITSIANAQSLTQANEPGNGASIPMYVCDSSFSNFSSTTGTGVTWNFSAITGYDGVAPKVVSVKDTAGSGFTNSTKVSIVEGFVSTFWNSTSSVRASQGFVFTEPTIGDVIVKFSTNEEKLMNYPFAVTNTFTDTYSGTLYNDGFTSGGAVPLTGSITSTIDGQGTLMLPGSISLSNVLRHKVVETSNATITFSGFPVNVTVTRTQYDYYNVGNSTLPIFSHINVAISSAAFNNTVTLVLSSVDSSPSASISDIGKNDFMIYPNPTQGKVSINGDFSTDASAIVLDYSGRTITSLENLNNGSTIDLSGIEKGTYLIVITNNGVKTTKSISVN